MRRALKKLGHFQDKYITMLCDNSSTVKLSKNAIMHIPSKHIDIRFHFLHDLTRDKVIELSILSHKNTLQILPQNDLN